VRPSLVLIVVVLLASIILLSVPPVGAAHGCAPSVPPPVLGSPPPAPANHGVILLNEVLSNPQSRWNCSEPGTDFTQQDAWVELYNPQNQAFNLYTAHAYLDDGPGTGIYYLPFGASIAAHGFLIIFPRTQVTFTLTATIRLLIAGVIIDQVTIPELGGDQSYARTSDGASKWQVTDTPTIDASNNVIQPTTTAPSSSTSTGNQGNGSKNPGSTSSNAPVVEGTQPAWVGLTLPTPVPTATAVPATGASVSSQALPPPSAQPSDDLAVPRQIALTLLVLALGLTLFWCWKLFSKEER
jgi:hypothetical protein